MSLAGGGIPWWTGAAPRPGQTIMESNPIIKKKSSTFKASKEATCFEVPARVPEACGDSTPHAKGKRPEKTSEKRAGLRGAEACEMRDASVLLRRIDTDPRSVEGIRSPSLTREMERMKGVVPSPTFHFSAPDLRASHTGKGVADLVRAAESSVPEKASGGPDPVTYPVLEAIPLDESRGRKRTRSEKDVGSGKPTSTPIPLMFSSDSEGCGVAAGIERKKKRGRPPTVGDYMGLREVQEGVNKLRREEVELLCTQRILLGQVDQEWSEEKEAELVSQFRQRPSEAIAAEMLDQLNSVAVVWKTSGNIKGTHQKLLKTAYRVGRAGVAELSARAARVDTTTVASRSSTPPIAVSIPSPVKRRLDGLLGENERMRATIATLRGEIGKLRGEVEVVASSSLQGGPVDYQGPPESLERSYPPNAARQGGSPPGRAGGGGGLRRKKGSGKTTSPLSAGDLSSDYVGRRDPPGVGQTVLCEDRLLPDEAAPPDWASSYRDALKVMERVVPGDIGTDPIFRRMMSCLGRIDGLNEEWRRIAGSAMEGGDVYSGRQERTPSGLTSRIPSTGGGVSGRTDKPSGTPTPAGGKSSAEGKVKGGAEKKKAKKRKARKNNKGKNKTTGGGDGMEAAASRDWTDGPAPSVPTPKPQRVGPSVLPRYSGVGDVRRVATPRGDRCSDAPTFAMVVRKAGKGRAPAPGPSNLPAGGGVVRATPRKRGSIPLTATAPRPANGKGSRSRSRGAGGGGRNVGPPPTPGRGGNGRRRVPATAAVSITCPEGEYAAVLGEARSKIALAELGIDSLMPRRGVTGALLLQISGEGREGKADRLASRLREVLGEREGVRVARPSRQAELRLFGLEESVTREEMAAAVASAGNCGVREVDAGRLRRAPGGVITAWVRCPVRAANAVVSRGRITVGWVSARVEALRQRPLQCYRCHEGGHVRATCRSLVDRSACCYRCGESGHQARRCGAPQAKCEVCARAGRPSNHRTGGPACNPPKRRAGDGRGHRWVNRTVTPVGSPVVSGEVVGPGAETVVTDPVPMETEVGDADRMDLPAPPANPEKRTPSPVSEAGSSTSDMSGGVEFFTPRRPAKPGEEGLEEAPVPHE